MKINIIGVPLFYGCDKPGVEKGPDVLRKNGLIDVFTKKHEVCDLGNVKVNEVSSEDKYKFNNTMKYLDEIININNELADKVNNSFNNGALPLIIGGDHALGMGSLAGCGKYFGQDLAVIWVDAHGDINTPETSPSGNVHGMPLAASMGVGYDALTNIYYNGCKVNPKNVPRSPSAIEKDGRRFKTFSFTGILLVTYFDINASVLMFSVPLLALFLN